MLGFQLYPRPSRPKHGRCSGKHLFQTTRLIADELLISSRFPHKFRNDPALILTEMLIWNEKDSVKYGEFTDQTQLFRFFARSSHCYKLHEAPTDKPRHHWTGLATN